MQQQSFISGCLGTRQNFQLFCPLREHQNEAYIFKVRPVRPNLNVSVAVLSKLNINREYRLIKSHR